MDWKLVALIQLLAIRRAPISQLHCVRLWYSIGALALVVIAVVSLLPLPNIGVNDKWSHALTYFLLAAWFSLLVERPFALVPVALGLFGYGGLVELLQGLTTYRQAELGDLFANGGGVLCGIWFFFTPLRRGLIWLDASVNKN